MKKLRTLLPTEKFLWDLYEIYNKSGDLLELIFPPNSSIDSILKYRFYGYIKNTWSRKHQKEIGKIKFSKMIQNLKQIGYLKTLKVKNNAAIMITSKGLEKLFKIQLKTIKKIKRRDNKWQMILFDIPENKRKQRNYFRKSLQYLGYQQLQKSIWVCPYDTLRETKDLIKRYNIKPFVELLLINKVGLG
jgi:hypothetical protein